MNIYMIGIGILIWGKNITDICPPSPLTMQVFQD